MDAMSIQQTPFGTLADGTSIDLFTVTNKSGLVAKITSFGLRITELHVPDRDKTLGNVVLGFDNLKQYEAQNPFFGATVGRYANRIALGKFTLDGKSYQLPINNGPNALHGGTRGFDKVAWQVKPAGDNAVRGTYTAADGEQGYPGKLETAVTMTLNDQNELRLDYEATTDKPTILNLTNHSYFNLTGAGNGTILDHVITIHADKYTPVDATLIPTGEIADVRGTPFDFTSPHAIGERIAQAGGYDHNFVLNKSNGMTDAALVRDPSSGRVMEVMTSQPGLQFYTGNFLDGSNKGIGGAYSKSGAFCLETQHFPDSPNRPNFPSTVLRPGETYKQTTIYRFKTSAS
jgi:aldose 1-epimerase